jgi:hypothetical protein
VAATERGLAAAVELARALGLRVDDPAVVRDVTNLLVHLRPSPVVARVSRTFTALRGRDWLEALVELHGWLAGAGAPVTAPADELPPGPHERDGFLITFWRWYEHDPDRDRVIADAAGALRVVHEALASFPGVLPHYTRADELGALLDRLDAAGEDVALLRRGLTEVLAAPFAGQPVHGDAHLGNVLSTPDGVLWTDFETACRAPPEYDLAASLWMDISLPERAGVGAAMVAAYGDYDADMLERMLPAYGIFNAAWTVELVRNIRTEHGIAVRDRRLDWWRERYAREM